MVQRVNTVAFQGVEVLDIDVQVQISPGLPQFNIVGLPDKAVGESRERVRAALHAIGLTILISIVFLSAPPAFADDVWKNATLTCDEANNVAMIQLNASYYETPRAANLPEGYVRYNPLNNAPPKKNCVFKNGQKLEISDETDQAFPYGQGGGDPGASFTFSVNDKYVFYRSVFYGAYGHSSQLPFVVILDDKKLVSCTGPDNSFEHEVKYQIKAENCRDISERLNGKLTGRELRLFEQDEKIRGYKPIVKDADICAYFGDHKNTESLEGEMYNSFSHYEKSPLTHYDIGFLDRHESDIDNDGIADTVYQFADTTHYFDGGFFVYFDDKKSEDDFLGCLNEGKCPENIQKDPRGNTRTNDVDFFVAQTPSLWKNSHVVSAVLLDEAQNYNARYTRSYIVPFRGRNYFYFVPLNWDTFPSSIVAELKPDNKLHTICTYKDGSYGPAR